MPAPRWGERAYHLRLGLWELTGKLHDGRGTLMLAYHDGSSGPIAMVLDRTISCELRDHRMIVAVHIVSEEPSQAMGRKWYGIYTGTPPRALGAIVSAEELTCDHGNVFLLTTSQCRRDVTITETIDVERNVTCPDNDEVDDY